MRIAFFEDETVPSFGPIIELRPVFDVLCGHWSVRERTLRSMKVTEYGVQIRSHLTETFAEANPDVSINDLAWLSREATLFLNGRWQFDPQSLPQFDTQSVGIIDGEIAWIIVDPLEASIVHAAEGSRGLEVLAGQRRKVTAPGWLAKQPWDYVLRNGEQLATDFAFRIAGSDLAEGDGSTIKARYPHLAHVGKAADLFIAPTATLDPYVVIDTSGGPVFIDHGAKIQAFSRIEGPCYIGPKSQLFRTNLREGSSIGPMCRVGGEVEGSILHGFVNKYHDGFLGHSYVCPWVNLGALTTNSDLKNDYSDVSVPLRGDSVKTGSKKVGCFIGDHTKTGLGTLFNTGTSVGVMCMILPGGELLPKHIPSFTRIWHGDLQELPALVPSLETAGIAMDRRSQEFTAAQERLLRHVFQATREERTKALNRAAANPSPASLTAAVHS